MVEHIMQSIHRNNHLFQQRNAACLLIATVPSRTEKSPAEIPALKYQKGAKNLPVYLGFSCLKDSPKGPCSDWKRKRMAKKHK